MDTWSLPKARPISCNDCPAFQRLHMSTRWFAESLTRLACVINTTFREKIYIRWCCIDRLSWQDLSECMVRRRVASEKRTMAEGTSREQANFSRFLFITLHFWAFLMTP